MKLYEHRTQVSKISDARDVFRALPPLSPYPPPLGRSSLVEIAVLLNAATVAAALAPSIPPLPPLPTSVIAAGRGGQILELHRNIYSNA
jgi:hypothetical protein